MYKILLILLIGMVLTACGVEKKVGVETEMTPTEVRQAKSVPLPSQEDVIRTFFELIDEKKIAEAIGMMSATMAPDDASKQTWGVMFNDFDSVKAESIEKSIGDNEYKVELAVKVNPRAADKPIPYYGYSDKSDVRFVKLVTDDQGRWKIDGISTGP